MLEFNDLKGHERNTLYIIGNGFDLFHDLNTRYSDFHDWLIQYGHDDFVSAMEQIFPCLKDGKPLLWTDFEKALGVFDPVKIHRDFFQGRDDGWFNKNIQNSVVDRIKPYINKIPKLLREWVDSIPLDNVQRLLNLSDKSLYLSFNYTLLLEKVYLIPPQRVLHIHESISGDKPLVTGHTVTYHKAFNDKSVNVEESVERITDALNNLRKPVIELIKENHCFFDSLENITHVVVFGHSLSEIDRLYFTEVWHHVHDDAIWFFVGRDENSMKYYKELVLQYDEILKKTVDGSKYHHKMKPSNCCFFSTINV